MKITMLIYAFVLAVFVGVLISVLICASQPVKAEVVAADHIPTVIEMNVSAYCKESCCCGKFADGITASGAVAEGFFVAAPPEYPFGTLMVVPGYADGLPVEVKDRGGSIKGNKLDLFFETHQEALNWGRQYLEVEVLEAK